ncbi:PLDc N-terminal domain-containing protein [Marinifilum fragile]|uniref:PLDc N-terminal domain-containing protein n=1 Tax=Marinifilum fragile TaxID=570161 RepID=UPI003899253A
MIVFLILVIILWCWAFIDIQKSQYKNKLHKLLFFILIIVFPVIGTIIYFQFSRKFKRSKKVNSKSIKLIK